MQDLISRKEAIQAIDDLQNCYNGYSDTYDKAYIIGVLEELPSVQPEIIRCGECKWFQCNMRMDGYLPNGVDEFECRHWCGSCDPVDFCSHAERRTE